MAEYRRRPPDRITEELKVVAVEELFQVSLRGFLDFSEFIGQELGQDNAQVSLSDVHDCSSSLFVSSFKASNIRNLSCTLVP